jgi:MFS family permease
MRRLLRNRDARVFLAGWAVSAFGDSAMFLVLGIWAKALTGSNSAAGLVFFVLVVPSLFSPLSGLVVDRVRRRPLLIVTNCLMAVAMLPLLLVHDRSDLWLIYLVSALYGVGGTVLYAARSAFLTVMLPRELLGDANAIFSTVREGLRLLAPLVGAGLYTAFGGSAMAILDSVTFLVVAAAVAFVRTPESKSQPDETRFLAEVSAGARHILRTLPLRQIVLTTGVCLLVVGFAETLIFAVIDHGLHRPPAFLGVLSSLQGVGAIVGGVTAAWALRRFGDVRLCGIGMLGFALGDASFASSSLALVAAGIVVAGFGVSWIIVGFATAIQVRTPDKLQGRVAGAADTLISGPQTASIALGAILVTVVDYRVLVALMAVVVAGCGAYLLSRRTTIPLAASLPAPQPSEALSVEQIPNPPPP